MRRVIINILAFSILLTSSSCLGLVYRRHTEPGFLGNAKSLKEERACVRSFLLLFTVGDASIERVKRESGISKIASVDHEYTEIIYKILYRRYCVIVTGE